MIPLIFCGFKFQIHKKSKKFSRLRAQSPGLVEPASLVNEESKSYQSLKSASPDDFLLGSLQSVAKNAFGRILSQRLCLYRGAETWGLSENVSNFVGANFYNRGNRFLKRKEVKSKNRNEASFC
ncbi:hypothetical protein [Abditibacterium utsteinense]|uniref:hypothetical protein n=1 Tax=Abditibacterium utsteinense TaxID=1960156 RepID=UPI001300938A|nr:hypothetical protein [Abditibacterium utsteinense]